MPKRPNVLFILSDQHNAKCSGARATRTCETPHLDRLAAEGVRFDTRTPEPDLHAQPRELPVRPVLPQPRLLRPRAAEPRRLARRARPLPPAGYRTAAVGKIHCPENWVENDCDFFREVYHGCSIGGCPEYTAYLHRRSALADRDELNWIAI